MEQTHSFVGILSADAFIQRLRAWIDETAKEFGEHWRCVVTVADGSFQVTGFASEGPDLVVVEVVDDKGAKLFFLGTKDQFLFRVESCLPEQSVKKIGYRIDQSESH
jgi:hypothetical protein